MPWPRLVSDVATTNPVNLFAIERHAWLYRWSLAPSSWGAPRRLCLVPTIVEAQGVDVAYDTTTTPDGVVFPLHRILRSCEVRHVFQHKCRQLRSV